MKIKALVTALLAAAAAPSFALVPGSEGNSNPILHVYGSGATAVDKQLMNLTKEVCRAGTLDIFTDDTTKPEGNKYAAFYCVMGEAEVTGLGQDYNVMIHKNSNGGSFNGVGPVASNAPEDQMLITVGPLPKSPTSNCGPTRDRLDSDGTPIWACLRTNVDNTQIVDFGISDVEPTLWLQLGRSFNNAVLTTAAMNANTFGIPVTVALRNALQVAQNLNVGSDAADDQPTLSRSEVASILAGNLTSWDQFQVNGTPLRSLPGVVAPVNARVQVCRRVDDSGTQAQANVFFHNFPCDSNASKTANDNTGFSQTGSGASAATNLNPLPASAAVIHAHDGSGGVTDCLNALNTANAWAIGIQSTEKAHPSFRFVKIDGYLPTLKNVADNKYHDWYTATIQWRNASSPNPLTGQKLLVAQKIRDFASSPGILAQVNASFTQPGWAAAGEVGLLALPYKPSATNKVFSVANPVATASREGKTGISAPNSCKTPLVVGNSEIGG